ncbi:MAG: tetratricopeptide repeat protein [Planctomycetes bacterium]|nr:tetratricopeptide repeat protein [Planctomycetota bacterium]
MALPPLRRVLPAVLWLSAGTAVAVLFGAFDEYNTDIGFHRAYGEWILDHGEVPRSPVLSGRFADREWHDDKWLFQAGIALAFRAGGFRALGFLRIALVLVIWGAFAVAARGHRHPALAAGAGAVALLALSERLLVRPELPAYAFVALFLVALDRWGERGSRGLFLLVPLQVLWANVHSYFVFGPVVVWAWAAGRSASWLLDRRGHGRHAAGPFLAPPRRALLVLALLVSAACFVQPEPVRGALFPIWSFAEVMGGEYARTREFVTEFEPSWKWGEFPASTHYAHAVLGLLAILALATGAWRKRVRLEEAALLLFFLAASLPMRRNIALFAVAGGVLVLAVLARLVDGIPRERPAWRAAAGAGTVAAAALLAMLAASLVSNRLHHHDRRDRRLGLGANELAFPDDAADFVLAHDLQGPVMNDLNIGGWLLWRLGREREPMIDGNMGAYPIQHLYEYHDVMKGQIPLAELQRRHGPEVFVLSTATSDTGGLLAALHRDPAYALVHIDPVATVWVRRAGPNGRVAERLAIDLAAREQELALDEATPPVPEPEPWWSGFDPRPIPDPAAEIRLGDFYFSLGDVPKLARASYLDAVRMESQDVKVYFHLGQVEVELGRLEQARDWLVGATRLDPGYSPARFELGLVLLARGERAAAVAELERAVELDGDRAEYWALLGKAYADSGSLADAERALVRALTIDPGHVPARRTLDEVRRKQRGEGG